MKNFQFKNPTKIIFGKDTIPKLSKELPKSAKIMMLYGGGSIKRNGIYEKALFYFKGKKKHNVLLPKNLWMKIGMKEKN